MSDIFEPASAPLEPVLAEMGRRWKASGIPDLYDGCLEPHGGPVSRERARNVRALLYPKPDLPRGPVEDVLVDGQVPVRIFRPHGSAAPRNTLVYFHGGGFVVGDLESHDAHAVRLANSCDCVVVLVDYRLAPEHRFPAAFDDSLAATRWAAAHVDRLGGDPARLAVGGDSAGGNLAAGVAIACRDARLPLAAQLLLYPATDLVALNGINERAYLGDGQLERLGRDPRVSPRHAASHAGLAPAILGVGMHDFLYQDNLAYARALRAAGVDLTLRIYPDLNHGFFSFTTISESSLQAARQLCDDLSAAFERTPRR